MMKWIDSLLNRITMYQLMLYYLIALLVVTLVYSAMGLLSYDPYALLFSTAFLLAVSALANKIFARTFGVPANAESSYISALILALIISPIQSYGDLWFLFWAAVLSMASKYILTFRGKHIFNPVALGVTLTYFTINQSASWWVGNARLLPFVLVGGLLVVRKIRRFDMVLSYLATVVVILIASSMFNGTDFVPFIVKDVLYSPYLFFAFVMLTEPLTAPHTHRLRVYYGMLVGFLFTPLAHIGSFYTTPELALLIGNVFSFIVSPKASLLLRLKAKKQIAPDVFEFVFTPPRRLAFAPGQYMEWTLDHEDSDSRGNRRFFTLASAPSEGEIKLGVKFYERSSSFKNALLEMGRNQEILASQLEGDFTLPRDAAQKIVLIAGGIGVTPFRSMIKYLLDKHQARPITLIYANRTADQIVYRDVFDRAERELGIHTYYILDDARYAPPGWTGLVGMITPALIQRLAPHYHGSLFYLSGPPAMVDAYKNMLHRMGVNDSHIKTDFFNGL